MANVITNEIKEDIRNLVYDFLAETCETDREELNDDINVLSDLGGDSLMFLEMLEEIKKKHSFSVELQDIGQYLLKNPPETIGDVIELSCLLYEHENNIVHLAG